MDADLLDAERRLLAAIQRQDLAAVDALLAADFLITTAGWLPGPADKPTWLAGLAEHRLDDFDLRLLAERRYGDVAVVVVESAQRGVRNGAPWDFTFRYTDVWVLAPDGGWRLAVRHASGSPRSA